METTYKLRLYPNKEQKTFIDRTLGNCRFVWNTLLSEIKEKIEKGEKPRVDVVYLGYRLVELKKSFLFLKESPSITLQQLIYDLSRTLERYQRGLVKFPRFKRRSNRNTFRVTRASKKSFREGKLYLPTCKVGIRSKGYVFHSDITINTYVVERTSDECYHVCLFHTVKDERYDRSSLSKIVAVDLGIKSLLTITEVDCVTKKREYYSINNPRFYNLAEKRLRRYHRQLSRKVKGSNNFKKGTRKLAKTHRKVYNQRTDHYHKISTIIAKRAARVFMEDLSITGMLGIRFLCKMIYDSSFYKMREMIRYKVERSRGGFALISRQYKSTQICSSCNTVSKTKIRLGQNKWVCSECNKEHDRDINASINILMEGLRRLESTAGHAGIYA